MDDKRKVKKCLTRRNIFRIILDVKINSNKGIAMILKSINQNKKCKENQSLPFFCLEVAIPIVSIALIKLSPPGIIFFVKTVANCRMNKE